MEAVADGILFHLPKLCRNVAFGQLGLELIKEWLAAAGALSPHNDSELDWYGDEIERGIAELVRDATTVRFDGSDLMPGHVGAGSFWKSMTDFFSGSVDADTALQEIDDSWAQ